MLKDRLQHFASESLTEVNDGPEHREALRGVQESLDVIIAFSHRNCPSLDQEQRKVV